MGQISSNSLGSAREIYSSKIPGQHAVHAAELVIFSYCKAQADASNGVIPILLKDWLLVYGYLTERRHCNIGTFRIEETRNLFK